MSTRFQPEACRREARRFTAPVMTDNYLAVYEGLVDAALSGDPAAVPGVRAAVGIDGLVMPGRLQFGMEEFGLFACGDHGHEVPAAHLERHVARGARPDRPPRRQQLAVALGAPQ